MSSLIVKVDKVSNIYKHPDADRLSIVEMEDNDWSCIVGLNQYEIGDSVIFVPPDAIMPDKLIDECKLDYLKGNGRVRIVKLRGFVSAGLILDLNVLKHYGKLQFKNGKITGIYTK